MVLARIPIAQRLPVSAGLAIIGAWTRPTYFSRAPFPDLPLIGRGKVRDIYSVDDKHLLIVTTDRLSAYDVILPDPIPGKGEVSDEDIVVLVSDDGRSSLTISSLTSP